jgi:hypothetical protein
VTPSFHAIGLLAVVGGTVFACIRMRGGPRWRIGLVTAIVTGFLALLFPGHLCDAGHPVHHLLIGAACMVAISILVKNRWTATGLSLAVVLVIGTLAWDYLDLVHKPGLTGNPRPREERRRTGAEARARQLLTEMAATDNKTYPASWLHEAGFVRNADRGSPLADIPHSLPRVEVRWLWHSWFTGIYECRRTPGFLWYPGGKLSEAAGRVEWREHDVR